MNITHGYRPSEFDALYGINTACFPPEQCGTSFAFRATLVASEVYVARVDDNIVGFALIRSDADSSYLRSIAVSPEYQGRGIAKFLLRYIIAHLKAAGQPIILNVHVNNPAQKLYFDEGFRVIGVLRNYYPGEKPSTGITMQKLYA